MPQDRCAKAKHSPNTMGARCDATNLSTSARRGFVPGHRHLLPVSPTLRPKPHSFAALKHVGKTQHSKRLLRNDRPAPCENPRTPLDAPTLGAAEGQGVHRYWRWKFEGNRVCSSFVLPQAILIEASACTEDGRAPCCSRMKVCCLLLYIGPNWVSVELVLIAL
jgi:hypothetical protein